MLASFLAQFYEEVPPPRADPGRPRRCPSASCSSEALCERAGRKVEISGPQRGDRREADRAGAAQRRGGARPPAGRDRRPRRKVLRELAETFELPEVPQRIEVYDNSHIMGTNAVGAMIVAGPEGFRKNSTASSTSRAGDHARRRFRDDARGARAAASPGSRRRIPTASSGEWPDLLLIDGGKGQLSAVLRDARGCRASTTCRWSASPRARDRRRRARGVPLARRARDDAAAQLAAAVLPPAAARRGPPLRHRRPPRQARQEPDHRRRSTRSPASARAASARC